MANRYLITGGGSVVWDASNTAIWSDTSGGATGASVPVDGDAVIMDASSGGGTVTLGYSPTVTSITGGSFTGTFDASTYSPTMETFSFTGTGVRTLTMGSGTWTLTGTGTVWNTETTTNLTLDAGNSTILVNDASATAKTIASGATSLNNLRLSGAGTGTFIIGTATTTSTFAGIFVDTPPHTVQVFAGKTLNVGSLYATGASGSLITFESTTASTPWNIVSTGGTIATDYVSLQDSVASGATFWAGRHSTDATGNTGWIFLSAPNTEQRYSIQEMLNVVNGTIGLSQQDCLNQIIATEGLVSNIDQSQVVSDNTNRLGDTGTAKNGQSFIPSKKNFTGFVIRKGTATGTYTGDVTISIQTDNSGAPSGTDIGTPVLVLNAAWNALTADTDYTVSYPVTLTVGTTYWIVVSSSTTDASNYSRLSVQGTGTYANGKLRKYDGASWSDASTNDLYFKTLYVGVLRRQDCWNIWAGTTGLRIRDAANIKASTTERITQEALAKYAGLSS